MESCVKNILAFEASAREKNGEAFHVKSRRDLNERKLVLQTTSHELASGRVSCVS